MKIEDQDAISGKYGIRNGRIFSSWLRSLNYLRNVCAHHSRLWNRNIIDQPKLPPVGEVRWIDPLQSNRHALARPFLLLCMTKHLLDVINPGSSWGQRLKEHLLSFTDLDHLDLDLQSMGASTDWETWSW